MILRRIACQWGYQRGYQWACQSIRAAAAAVAIAGLALGADAAADPATQLLEGRLLVAAPGMPDPRFRQSVIYLLEHGPEGALGLIVNRPANDVPLAELLSRLQLDIAGATGRVRLHYGGPVSPNAGFVLHSTDYAGDGTRVVGDGIAVTTHRQVFRAMAEGKGPKHALVLFGYAGWGAGQLEGEIEAGGWYLAPAEAALVFGADHGDKWRRALERRMIDL